MTAPNAINGVTLKCAAWAAVTVAALLGWQALIVYGRCGGDWTGLFFTGDSGHGGVPPAFASSTYIFKHSDGFDGQFYRYVAHDPFFRRGLDVFMDSPTVRYSRVLVPGLAWLLAAGRGQLIDPAYNAVLLGFVFLGAWWLARFSAAHDRHPAWGCAFGLLPATLISVDRMTVDVALAALCVGFVWYAYRDLPRPLYVIAVLAPLVRETGVILTAAGCLYALLHRRWPRAVIFATAAAPAWFWHRFIATHLAHPAGAARRPVALDVLPFSGVVHPFQGIVRELGQLPDYPLPPAAKHFAQFLDVVALAGILVAIGWAFWQARRASSQPESLAAVLFALLAVTLRFPPYWEDINGYGRTMTPLVLLVAMRAAAGESLWTLAPWAMLDLRLSAQFGSQTLAALHGLFAGAPHG